MLKAAGISTSAAVRIGELSAELEETPGRRTDKPLPSAGKRSKAEVLAAAGISTSASCRRGQCGDQLRTVAQFFVTAGALTNCARLRS